MSTPKGSEARFEHVVFVCTNEGLPGNTKQKCGKGDGPALLERLKEIAKERNYKSKVRVTRSGCLDLCARGCAAVVFSRNEPARETWYTHLKATDAERLLDSHVENKTRFISTQTTSDE